MDLLTTHIIPQNITKKSFNNNLASKKYRLQKKKRLTHLKLEVYSLEEQNTKLKAELQKVKDKNRRLIEELYIHNPFKN